MTARITQHYVEAGVQPDVYYRRLTQFYIEVGVLEVSVPQITTQEAGNITITSATLNGNLTDLGDELSVFVFFQWKEQGAVEWNETTPSEATETGAFSEALSDLSCDTNYEFRAVVKWSKEEIVDYGSTLTFKALAAPSGASLFFCHG